MLRICSFESRRGPEMQSLIERLGGQPTIAPSLREIPLEQNPAALDFAEMLFAGQVDIVVFLTGVGARALLDVVEHKFPREQFLAALQKCITVVRGPKPATVLREWGVRIDHRVPEPNTWHELLVTLDAHVPLSGRRIAVQEYGQPNSQLYKALEERRAIVTPVPVYRWELPDDLAPLHAAILGTIAGDFDILMFTSAQQVRHVLQVAADLGKLPEWRKAAARTVIASIGPTCTETLAEEGLPADFEPSHPKMGSLVKETLEAAPALLSQKRA
jgi:uroporphyrinogen-III synthase